MSNRLDFLRFYKKIAILDYEPNTASRLNLWYFL